MKKIVVCGIALFASLGSAAAADPQPLGEWLVEDAVARIRIVDCNTRLWGVISWEKKPGNVDAENPDRSKRSRLTLGMPVLLNMKKAPAENKGEAEQWEGKVYNAENGKTYDSKIKLLTPDKLEIKGCVLGFLCGGQTWTRYIDPSAPPAVSGTAPKSNVAKAKPAVTAGSAKGTAPADPNAEICLLPEIAGAPH
ncbi:DUF2147 domain-containing protein [Bradyrhizobium prioriisuperbiae]|uniref:DUF2147 domain-containing protein n=1 Tax=Bradyrhizobium prioriisuperbiae TaxID=2854389 RepID=UPI0028E42531|nr:DUF2147 domain-containing protein [Bradyrhizobium prioritasuperba]